MRGMEATTASSCVIQVLQIDRLQCSTSLCGPHKVLSNVAICCRCGRSARASVRRRTEGEAPRLRALSRKTSHAPTLRGCAAKVLSAVAPFAPGNAISGRLRHRGVDDACSCAGDSVDMTQT